ncbi:cation:proton antiporter [Enterococcus thailandicus]|uniref:cation:proton antiporter n=1 Tax=Enterococcus thailandicus TaxID=417368 RepID=UPI00288CCC85|nr:sodium:proton antiporter [Enterococcus thailandicus]MDT2752757.1 sodium:proton antiporter [Enterococcus thailandicus]MDT2777356.1 sodium:proton antiporter [Enterococcus thailandicus]
MEFAELVIIFAVTITASNIVSRILPVIPAPLIQIFLGVILGLTEWGESISFEPELFLVMIIAPLLFREGEKADVTSILKNFDTILFLAFGGVILTLLGVGMTLSFLLRSLPFAACFAFGAALGPTDAVAVSSLSGRVNIPKKAMHILEGEGLLNDASGVTAFQFALAALITGSFSAVNAGVSLVISSLGGALVGFLLVWVKRKVINMIEKASARDVTGYLLIELLLPFLAYVLAEVFGVSGIISAVVAGILQASSFRKITIFDAELSSLSNSTWTTVTFTLNALVFIFLGIELTQVFSPVWENGLYSNWMLILVILLISVMLFVIRFVSITAFYLFKGGLTRFKEELNEILILTFGGVKGTVSLATIFILPLTINGMVFHQRSLLLFLTAGVILVTLVVGILALPILTEEQEINGTDLNALMILEEVVESLRQEAKELPKNSKEYLATEAVIENYQERIRELYFEDLTEDEKQEVQEIQALILSIERDGLDESYRSGKLTVNGYRFYSRFLSRFERSITGEILSFIGFWLLFVRRVIRIILHPKMFWERRKREQQTIVTKKDISDVRDVYHKNTQLIIESLDNLTDVYGDVMIQFFIEQRKAQEMRMMSKNFFSTMMIQQETLFTKKMLRGYYLERKVVDEYEVAEKITTFSANDYRKNINLLESYTMNKPADASPLRFAYSRKKRELQTKKLKQQVHDK